MNFWIVVNPTRPATVLAAAAVGGKGEANAGA
jgi:hypothetical protein